MSSERMIGVEYQRATVGESAGEELFRWVCECGRHGRWTYDESKASRGMAMHDYKHRLAEHANSEPTP